MKTLFTRLFVLLLLGGLSIPLSAQPRNVGRFLMFQAKAHPSYARIIMENEAAQKAGPLPVYTQTEQALLASANFAAHNKRLLWRGLTRAGVTPRHAVLNLRKLGAYVHPLPKYPSVGKEYAWQTAHFAKMAPRPATLIPPLPFYKRRGYVYWAWNMEPNGNALRELLQKGLPKELPARAFYASPSEAVQRALQRKSARPAITVLVALQQTKQSSQPKIKEVLVWLERKTDSRWHRVELKGKDFALYPYFFRPPEK